MALTLTQVELSAAIRLGDSAEETAEATRLLAFVTEAISRHLGDAYEGAPEAIVNEAAIRLAGYLFDQPNAGRGLSFANAGRNSGAWAILLPFRVHRAGSTDDALAAAQEAVGSTVNSVVGVTLTADELVITFADGSVETTPFTPGGGSGVDQIARDTAATAQADLAAHEATPHNFDTIARDAAADAQSSIADHERAPHNTDETARTAAAAAQARADDSYTLADEKVDASGAATAAREITSDWAEEDNPDPIPGSQTRQRHRSP